MFDHIEVTFNLEGLRDTNTIGIAFANMAPGDVDPFFRFIGSNDGLLALERTLLDGLVAANILTAEQAANWWTNG